MIHLVGPGGAGKSTVGAELAARLKLQFIDLDLRFMERVGDISKWIDEHGYHEYIYENVQTYMSIQSEDRGSSVVALSSGFMTYPESAHPRYVNLRSEIASSPMTVVLLPSLDIEICVAETVRRQVARPFGRSSEREEAVIRERYAMYMAIPAARIETMKPIETIVKEIMAELPPNKPLEKAPGASKAGAPQQPIRSTEGAGRRML